MRPKPENKFLSSTRGITPHKTEAQNRNRDAMRGVTVRNPIDVLLHYLFESQMREAHGLTRIGDCLVTANHHKLSRDHLQDYLKLHWIPYGTEEISELAEVLDRYVKELLLTPTPETA